MVVCDQMATPSTSSFMDDDPLRSFCESNGLSDMTHRGNLMAGK